ncbi:hypothetical protein KYC5002_28325 [Archangium violaceum]|uniref:hypothetical protein n=1 Tax=Archangium violaceum TaxID=83451 RepID=UPI002B301A74|nr:hypothetical protein KYC5002_28325 [Archangium gephyra]
MSYLNIDAVIRRAIQLGLIRIDNDLPSRLDPEYLRTLKEIGELLERIRHGLTIRRMMYDHAEICKVPLDQQLTLESEKKRPLGFNQSQMRGLEAFTKASSELPTNQQTASINNPNIIVNCDSGTEGELGCRSGYIKVYQAVYSASYDDSRYKDVYVHNLSGMEQIQIQPAPGGKCNVSIGNPFRSVGWFLNYMNQGSKSPLIRMWEIPSDYYVDTLLRFCGTEKQIKDKDQKNKYFVEMCDHKAANQFGIWTHAVDRLTGGLVPTEAGKEFISKSRRLITYYDPMGSHTPGKRDGEARDIRLLLTHLGIPTLLTDRFHDFGMSLSDAEGNLTMNADAAQRDRHLLDVIEAIQNKRNSSSALSQISGLGKEEIRPFANLLTYNNLNPQAFNTSSQFTRTGLNLQNLRHETNFMVHVYKGTHWHDAMKFVVTELLKTINQQTVLPPDVKAALPSMCFTCTTYEDVLRRVLQKLGTSTNPSVIDSLNVILRPLCSGGNVLNLDRKSTKGQKFQVDILADLDFEIGKSHRTALSGHEGVLDPLDGRSGGGFVSRKGFNQPLSNSIKTSNTSIQLNLHDPVVSRLQDLGVPMLGGISGTTRDILATLHDVLDNPSQYWKFFNVVAAFMIKHHYHTLVECFIAAHQVSPESGETIACRDADGFYKAIAIRSRTPFYS